MKLSPTVKRILTTIPLIAVTSVCATTSFASGTFNFHPEDSWSKTGNSYYLEGFAGRSVIMLGSKEVRQGGGIGFGYGRPEPRFRLWSVPAQWVWEATVDETHGLGTYASAPNDRLGVHVFSYSRWRGRTNHGIGAYADLGFGLYFVSPNFDVNSDVSTTPLLGLGLAFRSGQKNEWLVGLRYRHISNAGTRSPNNGQNGIWLTVQFRF